MIPAVSLALDLAFNLVPSLLAWRSTGAGAGAGAGGGGGVAGGNTCGDGAEGFDPPKHIVNSAIDLKTTPQHLFDLLDT